MTCFAERALYGSAEAGIGCHVAFFWAGANDTYCLSYHNVDSDGNSNGPLRSLLRPCCKNP